MTDLFEVARLLSKSDVEFVIVGGVAIAAHGGSYITEDLDICYARSNENLRKIADVLAPLKPRPRGLDQNLPFLFDWTTLNHDTNFTFTTAMGDVDRLGEIKGVGNYYDLLSESITVHLDAIPTKILSIPALITAKRAAGRPKDEVGLKVLQALLESDLDEEE